MHFFHIEDLNVNIHSNYASFCRNFRCGCEHKNGGLPAKIRFNFYFCDLILCKADDILYSKQGTLRNTIVTSAYDVSSLSLETLRIMGLTSEISSVIINGASHYNWTQSSTKVRGHFT